MADITTVDSNFKVETNIRKDDLKFYDVKQAPFGLHGVFYENGMFRRTPEQVARSISQGLIFTHSNTAGGRVRFRTDSPYVAIHAEMPAIAKMPQVTMTGSAGFDLYVKEAGEQKYVETFMPPFDIENGYESVIDFGSAEMREITIYLPIYSNITCLLVGLAEKASLCPPISYKTQIPVVYYGSSITQGGCASRPGNAYESIISRKLDCDFINLGFAGSAMGEAEIADYIKSLRMSAFVFDYDHNSPSVEHLAATHQRMFRQIRSENPNLPILILSRPKYSLTGEELRRRAVIEKTYTDAKASGDEHVYFVDGPELMSLAGNDGTVDNCHPNDLGFASMALAVAKVLEQLL